jgi:hypothetical protein
LATFSAVLQALMGASAGSTAADMAPHFLNHHHHHLVVPTYVLLSVQALVDAWAGSAAGKAAAAAAAAHKHMSRTPSGVLALGAVNAGPVAGWARWAACLLVDHSSVICTVQ